MSAVTEAMIAEKAEKAAYVCKLCLLDVSVGDRTGIRKVLRNLRLSPRIPNFEKKDFPKKVCWKCLDKELHSLRDRLSKHATV